MTALVIHNLKKTYSNGLVALKGIDLTVEAGDFFALLGPNGAGKSTTIGIISSLVLKSSGSVSVFGYDIDHNQELAKAQFGVMPQEFNFNVFENVLDVIVNQAGYYGISRQKALPRAEKYLTLLGLWDKRNQSLRMLSGGMKRRFMLVRALIHEPQMLILDEPTAGVDIELRRSLWQFLREINRQGTTIILTTHYLEEAENLCRGIAIIDRGQIVVNTTVKELILRLDTETIVLDLKRPLAEAPQIIGTETILVDEHTLEVTIPKEYTINTLFNKLSQNDIEVVSLRNKTNRLEELFVRLTQKTLGEH